MATSRYAPGTVLVFVGRTKGAFVLSSDAGRTIRDGETIMVVAAVSGG